MTAGTKNSHKISLTNDYRSLKVIKPNNFCKFKKKTITFKNPRVLINTELWLKELPSL